MGKLIIILVALSLASGLQAQVVPSEISEKTEERIGVTIQKACDCAESLHKYAQKRKEKGKKITMDLAYELDQCAYSTLREDHLDIINSVDIVSEEGTSLTVTNQIELHYLKRLYNECSYYKSKAWLE